MLLVSGSRAEPISDSNVRARPVVSGGTLKTDTGQIIRAARVQESDPDCRNSAMWAACRALGLNTARVGVRKLTRTLAQVHASIDQVVEAARNNRCYVMLGNPETSPGTWDDNIAANRDASIAFWGPTCDRYRNEPHVFFEMLNEPSAWGQHSQYVDVGSAAPSELLVALRAVFDVMRAAAPDTVIACPSVANIDAPGGAVQYASVLAAWKELGPVDWTRTVWSYHGYNQTHRMLVSSKTTLANPAIAPDGGREALTWLKERFPLLMTESNWWMEASRYPLIDVADVHEDVGIGWTLMTHPLETPPHAHPFDGDLWPTPLQSKIAQLRDRGFSVPVE